MRILTVLIIWLLAAAGIFFMSGYAGKSENASAHQPPDSGHSPAGKFSIEILHSFSIQPCNDSGITKEGLIVRSGGMNVFRKDCGIDAGDIVSVAKPGIGTGINEIFIAAEPEDPSGYNALRLTVLDNGVAVMEKTFWSVPGGLVSGIVRFNVSRDGHFKDE